MSQATRFTLPEHLRTRRSAQRSESVVQVFCIGLAVACFLLASLVVPTLNDIRQRFELVINPAKAQGLPPDIELMGKLGTLRALAINWASIRADRLKEEGKEYEALQLHETICNLLPRSAKAWSTASWNMAYNISVMQYTPAARWKWVQNGIKLLRDRGLQFNPRSATLYYQLAYTYWHKLGDFLDDEHRAYRRFLAVEVQSVLGSPPPYQNDQEYFDWFKIIVDAPRDWNAFPQSDPDARAIFDRFQEADLSLRDFLRFVAKMDADIGQLVSSETIAQNEELLRREKQENEFRKLLKDYKNPDSAAFRLIAAARSKVMREEFKFDLDVLYGMMTELYGPFDMRSPFGHTLYWAYYGQLMTGQMYDINTGDKMNTTRLETNAAHQLVLRGRVICIPNFDEPLKSYVEESTNLNMIPYADRQILRATAREFGNSPKFKAKGIWGTQFKVGYVSKIMDWIRVLYLEGGEKNMRLAQHYLLTLRDNNPEPDGVTPQKQFSGTVEDFVLASLPDDMAQFDQSNAVIHTFLIHSLKLLGIDDVNGAVKAYERAEKAWGVWNQQALTDRNDRRLSQPLPVMYRDAILSYLQQPFLNDIARTRIWKHLPYEVQQSTYDQLRPLFEAVCDRQEPPWDIGLAFPEPPGMEAYRRQDQKFRGDIDEDSAELGSRFRN